MTDQPPRSGTPKTPRAPKSAGTSTSPIPDARTRFGGVGTDSSPVPNAIRNSAAWAWRVLLIAAAAALFVYVLQSLSQIVVPLAVAILLTALLRPVQTFLHEKAKFPGALATFVTVIGTIAFVAALFTFAGQQIASGMSGMLEQARGGLDQIVAWLHSGPLKLSDTQLQDYVDKAKEAFSSGTSSWISTGTAALGSVGHFLAGIVIALFATFFFLSQGQQIAVFLISLLPFSARDRSYQAGRRGWVSLTSYVRVQVVVAGIDAIGIGVGAWILQLPFVIALALLVFISSFIPIIGAIASGAVAVLVALVTHGPVSALVMLGVVLLVQQVESHLLQPFLMGRAVSLHPLAVLLAVVVGSSLLGIVGALFAVPVLAVINSTVRYFHGYDPFPELGAGPLPNNGKPARPTAAADPKLGDD